MSHRDTSVRRDPAAEGYNTPRREPPSPEAFGPLRTLVDAPSRELWPSKNEWLPTGSLKSQTCREDRSRTAASERTLLIPFASLLTVSRTVNFLFKVLFIFPSRYLFAIGLVPIFSFRRSLPPLLGCTPKQPDSEKAPRRPVPVAHTGFSPSMTHRSKWLCTRHSTLTTLL